MSEPHYQLRTINNNPYQSSGVITGILVYLRNTSDGGGGRLGKVDRVVPNIKPHTLEAELVLISEQFQNKDPISSYPEERILVGGNFNARALE